MSALADFRVNPARSFTVAPGLDGKSEFIQARSQLGLASALFSAPENASIIRALLMCPHTGPCAAFEAEGQPALLVDLCGAFADGNALLQPPPQSLQLVKQKALFASPVGRGQDVDVYRAKDPVQWFLVAARPSRNARGLNVYVNDAPLAERCARAFVEGRLRGRKSYHPERVVGNGADYAQ